MNPSLPQRPISGNPWPSGWFTRFYDAVEKFMRNPVTGDGKTIFVNGTCISAKLPPPGSGGGSSMAIVQITGQVTYNHYKCHVWPSGYYDDTGTPKDTATTGDDEDLWIVQIAAGSTITTGTRLDAKKVGTHYEANIPRWL